MGRIYKLFPCFFLFILFTYNAKSGGMEPGVRLQGNITIYTDAKPGSPVFRAVTSLQRDLKKVLGSRSVVKNLSEIKAPGIVIVNSGKSDLVPRLTGFEAHRVFVQKIGGKEQVVLQGEDILGTIYAIYTFSEKILGVPPLWFFCGWQPDKRNLIIVPDSLNIQYGPPYVKYRAWFPNDMDLLSRWRRLSKENNEIWLETALRLKINTIQWVGERWGGVNEDIDYSKKYSVSPTTKLVNDFGLISTTHHAAPLYSSLKDWNAYWKLVRDTVPPALSLANKSKLEDFWRYNITCVKKNNIKMLWEIGFRGAGDAPFWYTFKDAPKTPKERADVINNMLKLQRRLLIETTGDSNVVTTTIFYNEMSDLLAKGYLHPPVDSNFIWTFVAARRDPYPNKDIQELDPKRNLNLGYYYNLQFNSTGSHLVAGEGPWNMERNFRYVNSRSGRPLKFSVVNAGNIRAFLLGLSANAHMMWNFNSYNTDSFLVKYCTLYFGKAHARQIAQLYHDYFYAYWQQKKPDFPGFDRQYIFQDLRYKKALTIISAGFNKKYDPNPLKDYFGERVRGRTYRIVPEDNNAANQVDAIINGTGQSAKKFLRVAEDCDRIYKELKDSRKTFFNDNLRAPAYFMYYLNESLLNLCLAYRPESNDAKKNIFLHRSVEAFKRAKDSLLTGAHGHFKDWYAGDDIFGMNHVEHALDRLLKKYTEKQDAE